MQDYSFCTIFGEETREYPLLYASVFQFVIPNTGIILYISKGLIVRVNGSIKLEGVMPDISISNQLLDEIVNPLLKLL